ncbi:MAG: protein phosphatase CheZ [Proteobacteria bacterium]|nr:protein phosphatase CheZ [Pseudomonadota bacterium]
MKPDGIKVSVTKSEFLECFIQTYHAIKDYEELMKTLSDQDEIDPDHLDELLLERQKHMELGAVNVRSMELIGAFIRFALKRFKGEKLNFLVPEDPGDDFFSLNDAYLNLSEKIEEVEKELYSIEEKIYFLIRLLPPQNIDKVRLIIKAIAGMFKSIIRKDSEDLNSHINHIHHLTVSRESYFMFNDVGRMVRDIHRSLQDFSSNVPTDGLDAAVRDEMPDAIDKLNLVIQHMEDATNNTLDDVENLIEVNAKVQEKSRVTKENCAIVKDQLIVIKSEHPNIAGDIEKVLISLEEGIATPVREREELSEDLESTYYRIIESQSFQDITGQTLKKIISFIEELELKLLGILQKYSGVIGVDLKSTDEDKTGSVSPSMNEAGNNEQVDNKTGAEPAVKQSDIDSMLAEFGF